MATTTVPYPAAARSASADGPVTVRPLRPGDGLEVRRLFRGSIAVGRRLALQYADIVDYERECLDWYLSRGRAHGRVAEVDGRVIGYALPCLDHRALDRWTRRRDVRRCGRAAYRFAVGRLGPEGRHFLRLRLADRLDARRDPGRRPYPASAVVHLGTSAGDRARPLLAAMDQAVAEAGRTGWSYAVDVRDTASLHVLERDGQVVVRVVANRIASWLADAPVWRVTVARPGVERRRPVLRAARLHRDASTPEDGEGSPARHRPAGLREGHAATIPAAPGPDRGRPPGRR